MTEQSSISDDTMVVTSTYITLDRLPILEVSHEDDEEGGSLWQFHCGNGDFSMESMQLVRFDTLLNIDPNLSWITNLKVGTTAKRKDGVYPSCIRRTNVVYNTAWHRNPSQPRSFSVYSLTMKPVSRTYSPFALDRALLARRANARPSGFASKPNALIRANGAGTTCTPR
jgi:hypothetical protein